MQNICKLLATGFGLGNVKASGTVTSALAALLYYLLAQVYLMPLEAYVLLTLAVIGAGFYIIPQALKSFPRQNDPAPIVWDEIAGQMLALTASDDSFWLTLIAFGFFRLFDVLKPCGIKRLERFPSATGIMADDLAAGAAAFAATLMLKFFLF